MRFYIKYILFILILLQFLNCKKDEDTTVSFNATVANSSEGSVDFTSGDYDIGSSITITATPKQDMSLVIGLIQALIKHIPLTHFR